MRPDHYTTRRVRERYLRALRSLPLPIRSTGTTAPPIAVPATKPAGRVDPTAPTAPPEAPAGPAAAWSACTVVPRGSFPPLDQAGLPVLAYATVDERELRFSLVRGQARFRLTFTAIDPDLIGHVIDLDTHDPRLTVSTPLHVEWGLGHHDTIVQAAQRLWGVTFRTCEG